MLRLEDITTTFYPQDLLLGRIIKNYKKILFLSDNFPTNFKKAKRGGFAGSLPKGVIGDRGGYAAILMDTSKLSLTAPISWTLES